MAGEPYNLTCSVTVVDRLIVSPEIEWIKGSVVFFNKNNDSSVDPFQLILSFDFLNTSDAEEYVCLATVTINEINFFAIESSVEVINLQSEFYSGLCNFYTIEAWSIKMDDWNGPCCKKMELKQKACCDHVLRSLLKKKIWIQLFCMC